jgi:hypothetical protein
MAVAPKPRTTEWSRTLEFNKPPIPRVTIYFTVCSLHAQSDVSTSRLISISYLLNLKIQNNFHSKVHTKRGSVTITERCCQIIPGVGGGWVKMYEPSKIVTLRENRSTQRETCPSTTSSNKVQDGLAWDRARTWAISGRRPTDWPDPHKIGIVNKRDRQLQITGTVLDDWVRIIKGSSGKKSWRLLSFQYFNLCREDSTTNYFTQFSDVFP